MNTVKMGEEGGLQPLPKNFMTKSIHGGYTPNENTYNAVSEPLVMTTTFKQHGTGAYVEFEYGRTGNPTRNSLETRLASLEGGKFAATYPSGLGATTAVVSLLRAGEHLISGDDIYGGTSRNFREFATNFGIETSFIDTTDLKQVEAAIRANTKMIWIETITNPTLKMSDIKALADISKKHNLILAVDNSFLTPYFHRPLEFGVDVVMHSITKYLNGHSDVMMGVLITNSEDIYKKLKIAQDAGGIIPSPYDCAQAARGLKTLALRMRQHNINSYEVANFLMAHPKVSKVLHPGLPNHPHHDLFKRQCSGYCGMVSFYHTGGFEESKMFLAALKLFTVAGSLGGVHSLAELPMTLSHKSIPIQQLKQLNITDNLIRLSLGIEDPEDLIADLSQALDKI